MTDDLARPASRTLLVSPPERPWHVLFLCTANSARSIMAEAALRHWGGGRFRAFSAGSHPAGRVHPLAIELLEARGYPTAGLRSKSWDELARPGSPPIDLVITVCDRAAGEACPLWPGAPVTAHWGVDDPAAVAGPLDQQRRAFAQASLDLERRIRLLLSLPAETLAGPALRARLDEIGRSSR